MGFELNTYGSRRTEITNAAADTATVLHRDVPVGWRSQIERVTATAVRSMPPQPTPPDDPSDSEAAEVFADAAEAFADAIVSLSARIRSERVKVMRAMLDDLVLGFEGVTIDGESATVKAVLDALELSGGEHDRGQALLDLGDALMDTATIGPDEEKS